MIVKEMSWCPRCSSMKTGRIEIQDGLKKRMNSLQRKANDKGYILRFITPEEYRTYYKQTGANAFCMDCGYEFIGTLSEADYDFQTPEDRIIYEDIHGITQMRLTYEKYTKLEKLWNITEQIITDFIRRKKDD